MNSNLAQINKPIESLLNRMERHESNAISRHTSCEKIETRLDIVEKNYESFDDKFKDHIRKTTRTAIIGGLVGGMIGKLTPELGGLLVKLMSKLFLG